MTINQQAAYQNILMHFAGPFLKEVGVCSAERSEADESQRQTQQGATSGAMWMNIIALAWPWSESCSSCVSLELRKGTWRSLLASAAITSPSALKDLRQASALRGAILHVKLIAVVAQLLPTSHCVLLRGAFA